jgi:glycosyltransferase involved in cell wall biosynthesis
MNKLPITALIINYNEAKTIKDCLSNIMFCNQVIFVDLYSTDDSVRIAQEFGVEIHYHDLVPAAEWIQEKYLQTTINKWVLLVDPDEIYTAQLQKSIVNCFEKVEHSEKIGSVTAPIIYFFKNKRLNGTKWGGVKKRDILVHNERFTCYGRVQTGRILNDGFENFEIIHEGFNHINHFWSDSWRNLILKHQRYLKYEGKSRGVIGQKSSIKSIVKKPFIEFYQNFFTKKGYLNGITGFLLSLFRAYYFCMIQIKIYEYHKAKT